MSVITYAVLGLIAIGCLVALAWRLASRRFVLPCPSWLGWMLENPFNGAAQTRIAIERLDLRPGMTVVDVGCGPGRLTIPIAQAVGPKGQVTALDLQPAMLRRAQERAAAAQLTNIGFIHAGAGDGQLERDYYDRALLVTVLGEIRNREAALQEIFEALKPGGTLSVSEVLFDPHYQSHGTVVRLAMLAGFREQTFFGNPLAFTVNLEKPPEHDLGNRAAA
jgi:SAM-dependent methyltransferase